MKNRHIISLCMVLCLLISSCIRDQFIYDNYSTTPYLVLSGHIGPKRISVHLTQLELMNEEDSPDIISPSVELYKGETLICELKSDNDTLFYNTKPLNLDINTEYKIKASTQLIDEVITEPLIIPSKPDFKIDSIQYINPIRFHTSIMDSPSTTDLYFIKTISYFDGEPDSIHNTFSGDQDLIHDKLFIDNSYDTIIEFFPNLGLPDSIDLILYNIHPDFINFQESYQLYKENEGVWLVRLNKEVYSNVIDGYGFISSCNTDTIKIRYPD